jgi:hypothetical protein
MHVYADVSCCSIMSHMHAGQQNVSNRFIRAFAPNILNSRALRPMFCHLMAMAWQLIARGLDLSANRMKVISSDMYLYNSCCEEHLLCYNRGNFVATELSGKDFLPPSKKRYGLSLSICFAPPLFQQQRPHTHLKGHSCKAAYTNKGRTRQPHRQRCCTQLPFITAAASCSASSTCMQAARTCVQVQLQPHTASLPQGPCISIGHEPASSTL